MDIQTKTFLEVEKELKNNEEAIERMKRQAIQYIDDDFLEDAMSNLRTIRMLQEDNRYIRGSSVERQIKQAPKGEDTK